jgi:hypothetical protein
MQGLLDFIKTPEGQGLLSAAFGGMSGAQRGTPWNNIGRAGVAGVLGYNNGVELQQKQQMSDMRKQVLGEMNNVPSSASAALASGAQQGSKGPTMQNAGLLETMPRPKTGGVSMQTLQQAAILGMPGVDTLFNISKYQNDGIERKAGSFYQNPTTGEREYINDPAKGFQFKDGMVSGIPGFNETIAAQEGAKAQAQEGAKAGFNLLPLGYVGTDGRPIGGSVRDYLQPGQPATPQGPQTPQRSAPQTPQNFPRITPQQQAGRDSEALQIIQAELQNEQNPTNRAALQREIDRMTGRPALQSEVEREAAIGKVRMQNTVDERRQISDNERIGKDKRLYSQLQQAIPMARDLLQNATGSGAGQMADKTMAFFGKATKGAEAAQALDTLGGWMVSNVPRMEGPQSNIDVINYQTMAGKVADRTLPNEVRLAALETLEELQRKYARSNGYEDKPSGSLMAELPKAAQYKGKMAIDHETGKKYKSNGMQWIEAK